MTEKLLFSHLSALRYHWYYLLFIIPPHALPDLNPIEFLKNSQTNEYRKFGTYNFFFYSIRLKFTRLISFTLKKITELFTNVWAKFIVIFVSIYKNP